MQDYVKALLDRIDVLMAIVAEQASVIAVQAATIDKLNEKVKTLEERVNKNSKISSKPPSSDGLEKTDPKSLRKSSGKKPGAQVGHHGSGLKFVKAPDETKNHNPKQ